MVGMVAHPVKLLPHTSIDPGSIPTSRAVCLECVHSPYEESFGCSDFLSHPKDM